MTSRARRLYQAEDIKQRATEPSQGQPRKCSVLSCGRPTQRSIGRGLSEVYCKAHIEHARRHGSTWRRSYLKAELEPYRRAARKWMRANVSRSEVTRVVAALDRMISEAGRIESAFKLRGKPADEKARIALARLREAGKRGEQLLEITLTVKATMAAIGPRANPEFEAVQIAKMIHRLASGTILRAPDGTPYSAKYAGKRSLFERYPRAEGAFMRILGRKVEDIAGIIATPEVIGEVLALVEGAG